jgi:hypothetical protein
LPHQFKPGPQLPSRCSSEVLGGVDYETAGRCTTGCRERCTVPDDLRERRPKAPPARLKRKLKTAAKKIVSLVGAIASYW